MSLLSSIALGLWGLALAASVCCLRGRPLPHLPVYRVCGLLSASNLFMAADAAAAGDRIATGCFTVLAMYFAWKWWKGGGGDDTKRRLRRLRRAFTPARRTAPAAA